MNDNLESHSCVCLHVLFVLGLAVLLFGVLVRVLVRKRDLGQVLRHVEEALDGALLPLRDLVELDGFL